MPRRRFNKGNHAPAKYQWYGGLRSLSVQTVASTSVEDITQLRPAHVSLDAARTTTVERCVLHFAIRA